MPLQSVARCDCGGCTTPPEYGVTLGGLEWDLVTRPSESRWQIHAGVVRCPNCVLVDRWPEASITTTEAK